MANKSEIFFINELLPVLKKNKKCLVIPLKVKDEIEKHIKNSDKESDKYKDVVRALNILKTYNNNGLLKIYGDDNEPFVDALILSILNRFITMYNIAIITNDTDLTTDIDNIKKQKSIQRKKSINLFRIKPNGKVQRWYFQKKHEDKKKQDSKKRKDKSKLQKR